MNLLESSLIGRALRSLLQRDQIQRGTSLRPTNSLGLERSTRFLIELSTVWPYYRRMIKNNFEAHKTAALDEAAQSAAALILKAEHCSVAESVQLLLNYIAEHEGGYMMAAAVTYVEQILQGVLDAVEPEQAVL